MVEGQTLDKIFHILNIGIILVVQVLDPNKYRSEHAIYTPFSVTLTCGAQTGVTQGGFQSLCHYVYRSQTRIPILKHHA